MAIDIGVQSRNEVRIVEPFKDIDQETKRFLITGIVLSIPFGIFCGRIIYTFLRGFFPFVFYKGSEWFPLLWISTIGGGVILGFYYDTWYLSQPGPVLNLWLLLAIMFFLSFSFRGSQQNLRRDVHTNRDGH